MTYSVVWSLVALQQETRVETASSDPERARQAAARIDYLLRRCPRDMGASREPGYRVWYEDVLGVYYQIDETAHRVEVLLCGPARRH